MNLIIIIIVVVTNLEPSSPPLQISQFRVSRTRRSTYIRIVNVVSVAYIVLDPSLLWVDLRVMSSEPF